MGAVHDCSDRGPHEPHPVFYVEADEEGAATWVRGRCLGVRPEEVYLTELGCDPEPYPYPFGIEPDDSREDFEEAGRRLHEKIFGTPAPNQG